jgi:hypothetical protein
MHEDPIVQEVRRAREEIFAKYGYDLDALFDAMKELERKDPRKKVSFPPKRLTRPRK